MEEIFRAAIEAARAEYDGPKDPRSISATGLLKPPRLRALSLANPELQPPDEGAVYALLGTALHSYLEKAAPAGTLAEVRFETKVQVDGTDGTIREWTISGKPDLVEPGASRVTDYKLIRLWSFLLPKDDWTRQLSIYAWLLAANGVHVETGRIVALIRDLEAAVDNPKVIGWAKKNGVALPSDPRQEIQVQLLPPEYMEDWIYWRLQAHEAALSELPRCTEEETWQGRRCARYCPVASVCSQYREAADA